MTKFQLVKQTGGWKVLKDQSHISGEVFFYLFMKCLCGHKKNGGCWKSSDHFKKFFYIFFLKNITRQKCWVGTFSPMAIHDKNTWRRSPQKSSMVTLCLLYIFWISFPLWIISENFKKMTIFCKWFLAFLHAILWNTTTVYWHWVVPYLKVPTKINKIIILSSANDMRNRWEIDVSKNQA